MAGEPLTATALAKAFPHQQASRQMDFDLINLFWGQPAAWCYCGRSGKGEIFSIEMFYHPEHSRHQSAGNLGPVSGLIYSFASHSAHYYFGFHVR